MKGPPLSQYSTLQSELAVARSAREGVSIPEPEAVGSRVPRPQPLPLRGLRAALAALAAAGAERRADPGRGHSQISVSGQDLSGLVAPSGVRSVTAAGSGARTRTSREGQKILSLPRLPISPSRQARPAANFDYRKTRKHTPNAPSPAHPVRLSGGGGGRIRTAE